MDSSCFFFFWTTKNSRKEIDNISWRTWFFMGWKPNSGRTCWGRKVWPYSWKLQSWFFYIVKFTYFPYYNIQEDIELDGNWLGSDNIVCNVIYVYHGQPRSYFYFEPEIRQYHAVVLTRTVFVHNFGVKVCTWRNKMVQGNYIHSSRQTVIIRQWRFERNAIEYDQIKDEIIRM